MNDLRFALRQLLRNPGFTLVAVLLLGIGIGASTTMFSVVDAVFLRPCPYRNSDRLVKLYATRSERNQDRNQLAGLTFRDWREHSQSFSEIAGWISYECRLSTADNLERTRVLRVSPELFALLGVRPTLGRAFLPAETKAGGERVVILSHGHWQRWFHGDPNVIGQTLTLDSDLGEKQQTYTVVGVLPASFRWVFDRVVPGLWFPLRESDISEPTSRVATMARLQRKISLAQAQAEIDVAARRLAQAYPETHAGVGARAVPVNAEYQRMSTGSSHPQALWILLGVVNAVLVIACLNVANLLLVRASGREREMAIRATLGSGRVRLMRQLLTENLLLAALGALLGMVLAYWAVEVIAAFRDQSLPLLLRDRRERFLPWFVSVHLDNRALLYALAVSLVTCGLFSLMPLLGAARVNLSRSLAGGQTASGSVRVRHGLGLFVVSEVAIACVLLMGAGLLVNSAVRLRQIHPGFNPRNVFTAGVLLRDRRYANAPAQKQFFREALDRVRRLPGVLSADVGGPTPVGGGGGNFPTRIDGDESAQEHRDIRYLPGSPDCFRVLQIPLLQGRFFTDRDDATAPPVLIVNEAMARSYWPESSPIGRHVTVQRSKTNSVLFEIVGVVGNVYNYSSGMVSPPEAFTSWLQYGSGSDEDLVIRTAADAGPMKAVLQQAIRGGDDTVEIYNAATLEEGISRYTWSWSRQFNTLFLGGFAAVAFLLASIGVYGVTAYSVAQRTREIGIRMALGARRENVLALVLRQGMRLAVVGVGLGLAGAFAGTRVVRSMLFGISPTDPLTFGLITALVSTVAFVACWLPARRAARLDPMVALRYE
ncbi:MAG: ABC transporter permease [Verrucomicrobia bacterium]|nr:ABC transporter permease [Verrucomicrobiota bacterium]